MALNERKKSGSARFPLFCERKRKMGEFFFKEQERERARKKERTQVTQP